MSSQVTLAGKKVQEAKEESSSLTYCDKLGQYLLSSYCKSSQHTHSEKE
jgi:hypothetical protein